jgi:hypothetical protein
MRKLATILSLVFSLSASATKIFLNGGGDGGVIIQCWNPEAGFYLAVSPGDTLVVNQSVSAYCSITGLYGTSLLPVVIINTSAGQVVMQNGFDLRNCKYFKLTGTGAAGVQYGFRVTQNTGVLGGVAISVQGRSSDFTVEWVDVYKKLYGAWFKEDPKCPAQGGADSLNYPTFHMNNVTLQDCRFKNIGQDCIYAGNTDPTGNRDYDCDGNPATPPQHFVPMRLSNVKLLRLNIDSVVRSAIQLSGADSGVNEIGNCIISRCGYQYDPQQGVGIVLGGMTTNTRVHDNVVRLTYLPCYTSFGVGTNTFDHNSADSAGYLRIDTAYHKSQQASWTMDTLIASIQAQFGTTVTYSGNILKNTYVQPQDYFFDTRPTTGPGGSVNNQGIALDSSTIIAHHNQAGKSINDEIYSRSIGIYVYQSYRTYNYSGSIICSNTKLDGVTPTGISWRGAVDGQDPNPPSTYEFHFSTDCSPFQIFHRIISVSRGRVRRFHL